MEILMLLKVLTQVTLLLTAVAKLADFFKAKMQRVRLVTSFGRKKKKRIE